MDPKKTVEMLKSVESPAKQQKMAGVLKITLDNLAARITTIKPSENKVTKKSILEILSKDQKHSVKFFLEGHAKEGLTIQHLDPRQNRFNSVRYQFLKTAGHYLGERIDNYQCKQEGCDYFCTIPKIYFISFGDDPKNICMDITALDDKKGLGSRPSTKHLFDKHPEFVAKKLQKMGVMK